MLFVVERIIFARLIMRLIITIKRLIVVTQRTGCATQAETECVVNCENIVANLLSWLIFTASERCYKYQNGPGRENVSHPWYKQFSNANHKWKKIKRMSL